jgi:hypothetical protein
MLGRETAAAPGRGKRPAGRLDDGATMTHPWRRALVILALAVASLSSTCNVESRMQEKSQDLTEELMTAAIDFNRMITWRYFDEASAMVVPRSRADFLLAAEQIYNTVRMEGYKITLVQVSDQPFPRIRGEIAPPPPAKRPEVEAPQRIDETPADAKPKEKGPEQPKKKMPKVWYGLALVRFINLTVTPHNQVRSPMIRQYWFWREEDETWMVDPEIDQLLELAKPQAAAPGAPPPPPPRGDPPPLALPTP